MTKGSMCCCCFSNNVRHLVLLLGTFCLTAMFANVLLFNLTFIYNRNDIVEALFRTDQTIVAGASAEQMSDGNTMDGHNGTSRLSLIRVLRAINASENDKDVDSQQDVAGHPIVPAGGHPERLPETVNASDIDELARNSAEKNDFDEGHPVVSTVVVTTTQPLVTQFPKTKPSVVYFTRTSLETTTTTSSTTPRALRDDSARLEEATTVTASIRDDSITEIDESRQEIDVPLDYSFDHLFTSEKHRGLLRALLLAAPGLGALIAVFPVSILMRGVGARKIFGGLGIISAIATAALPHSVQFGIYPLIAVRAVQGGAFAGALPLVGLLTANWGTLKEQFCFIGFISIFVQLAAIISWPTTSLLVSATNLNIPFYTHSAITFLLFLVWMIFYRDRPQYHPWVNGIELNRIVSGKIKSLASNRLVDSRPCLLVLRSISAWTVWAAAFGYFFAISCLIIYGPLFLRTVLDLPVVDIAYTAAVPFLLMVAVRLFAAVVNRFAGCCKAAYRVRFFNCIAFVFAALAFIFLAIWQKRDSTATVFVLVLLPLGFSVAGFYQSATLVGRYYTQFIVAHIQTSFALAMSILPFVVWQLVPNNTADEWRRVFVVVAAVLMLTNVAFVIFGRGSAASWAADSWIPSAAAKMLTTERIDLARDEAGLMELKVIKSSK